MGNIKKFTFYYYLVGRKKLGLQQYLSTRPGKVVVNSAVSVKEMNATDLQLQINLLHHKKNKKWKIKKRKVWDAVNS